MAGKRKRGAAGAGSLIETVRAWVGSVGRRDGPGALGIQGDDAGANGRQR